MSGLIGRPANGSIAFGEFGLSLLVVGLLGALIGSQLEVAKFSSAGIRRALGTILTIAVATFWFKIIE